MRRLTLFTAVAATALAGRTYANPWSDLAIEDLHGIHDIIRDNHPGPVDPENPQYRDWLEGGLRKAIARAKTARTYSDYVRALRFYTNGFDDDHLWTEPITLPRSQDWAGFVVGEGADGTPEVILAEPHSGVKVGDRIESCDGQSFDVLMKTRVDPYFVEKTVPQSRSNSLTEAFVVNPDELDRRVKSCRFSSGEVKLDWQWASPDQLSKKFRAAFSGTDNDFTLKQVDGVWFVRLPRFGFNSDEDQKSYEALLDEVKAKAPELRRGTVVIDVRANPGGGDQWGYKIAAALWGDAWAERSEAIIKDKVTIDWRVSSANLESLLDEVKLLQHQKDPADAAYQQKIHDAMLNAKARGKLFTSEDESRSAPVEPPPPNPVTGRVFLLTDPGCASACLNFADLVLHIPNVVQIGAPTGADAVYIDGNTLPLPSRFTYLFYGRKVYRHRIRANNQWYEPKYRWPGGEMTDAAIAKWVKSLPPPDGSGPIIAGGNAPRTASRASR